MSNEKLSSPQLSRRKLLKVGAISMGGLILSTWVPSVAARSKAGEALAQVRQPGQNFEGFGAFVQIATDGRVRVVSSKIEMGQGIQTGIAMMVAEELEVGMDQVEIQEAPPDNQRYLDPLLHMQGTGGSFSTRSTWEPLCRAGATARIMLIQAAALKWQVSPAQCHAKNGQVFGPQGQIAGYGELAEAAAQLPIPTDVPLKNIADFTLLGKPVQRLDTPHKVNGQAKFTIDLQVPDMLIASTLTCPVRSGKLRTVDEGQARQVPGVRDIIKLDNAVAVTATNFWACQQALKALRIEWDYGEYADADSSELEKRLKDATRRDGVVAKNRGDMKAALKSASQSFEAVYEQPLLSHSPLEPMGCVAHVTPDGCELWVGSQAPVFAQAGVSKITGLPVEKITLHNQLIGGAFGRRLESDFIFQAADIARHVSYPIKLIWSREEDMTHDYYRPHYIDNIQVALDEKGQPQGWEHSITGGSVFANFFGKLPPDNVDPDAVEIAVPPIYTLPSLLVRFIREDPKIVPISWIRGVGPLRSTFVLESFIDELAHNAQIDPVEYRANLIEEPRTLAVLRKAAELVDWHKPLPLGRGRGIAVSSVFGSHIATVVELQMEDKHCIRITRLLSVIDCGFVNNPTSVQSQIEGGTLFGLSSTLFNEISLKDGQVEQKNFNAYRVVRMSDVPPVEVHLMPSLETPGGVGEAGAVPAAAALCNALYAATNVRIRRLPLSRFGYYTI